MTMKDIPLVEEAVLCILDSYYFSLATDEYTVSRIKTKSSVLKKKWKFSLQYRNSLIRAVNTQRISHRP